MIDSAYINALLADASYVRLQSGGDNDPVGEPLLSGENLKLRIADRLTLPQAEFITSNFEIVTQELSPAGGFDAVVWRGKAGTEYAGEVYVSMRGTQGGQDIADDISLASRGIPYNQIRDMVNWWLRNTATEEEEAIQINVLEAPGVSAMAAEVGAAAPASA